MEGFRLNTNGGQQTSFSGRPGGEEACFHPAPGEQSPSVSTEGASLGLWDAGAPDQANPQGNLRILCPALFQTTKTRRKWSGCGQHEEEEARKLSIHYTYPPPDSHLEGA